MSWLLANSGSTCASGTQWNARSHAAYQGVLPGVRHRDHVGVVQMSPGAVAALPSLLGWWRPGRVAGKPAFDVVVEELFPPLIRYFTLTPADEMFVRKLRGPGNVLGAAVQLCTFAVAGLRAR